jgi:hypothetical protein
MSLFDDLDLEPDAAFVDRLEAMLLLDLAPQPAMDGDPTDDSVIAPILDTTPARRRRWMPLAAAIVLLAVVVTSVVLRGVRDPRPPHTSVPATATSTTTPSDTTEPPSSGLPAPVPPGSLSAGEYSATAFATPFTFTVGDGWSRDKSRRTLVNLHDQAISNIVVTAGVFAGDTPTAAIDHVCPGMIDFSAPIATTLLGRPAVKVVGPVTASCPLNLAPDMQKSADPGTVVEVVAADVDGTVVVVLAGALSTLWPTFQPTAEAVIASMQLIP